VCVCVSTGICEFFRKINLPAKKRSKQQPMPNEKGSLQGRKNIDRTGVRTRMQVDRAGFEPAASALRTRRSYQADLPARSGAFLKKYHI
jgi:hypothetical protein